MHKIEMFVIVSATTLALSVSGCAGFDPWNPTSTAPLERALAKASNPSCENTRESMQEQVKKVHGKGNAAPVFAGNWRCKASGVDNVEVWYVRDTGASADGALSSWENEHLLVQGFSAHAKQDFLGAHDGSAFVFFSENPALDFAGKLEPNGKGLRGMVVIRNEHACQSFEYACSRM